MPCCWSIYSDTILLFNSNNCLKRWIKSLYIIVVSSLLLRNFVKNMWELCLYHSCSRHSVPTNLSLGCVTFLPAFLSHPGSLDRILRQDYPVVLPAGDFLHFFFKHYNVFTQKPQNRLVDVCEKIQLQAQRIEKFIDQTLSVKEQKLQVRCATQPTTLQHTQQQ